MDGVFFIYDHGHPTAVYIDLATHGPAWREFCDNIRREIASSTGQDHATDSWGYSPAESLRRLESVREVLSEGGAAIGVIVEFDAAGELWEDFSDIQIAKLRRNEPRVPISQVAAKLRQRDAAQRRSLPG